MKCGKPVTWGTRVRTCDSCGWADCRVKFRNIQAMQEGRQWAVVRHFQVLYLQKDIPPGLANGDCSP